MNTILTSPFSALGALALGALALAAPDPTHPLAVRSAEGGVPSFPIPAQDLEIPAQIDGRALLLSELVEMYAAATDQVVVVQDEQSRNMLESTTVQMTGSITVPPERVQLVFETLLARHSFLLGVLVDESPRLLSLTSLQTSARVNIRRYARYVPPEHVQELRGHPAMLFTTVVHMPRSDVRQLANAMRTMITDANVQQMLPAGNTNSLVLTGPGDGVASLVEMLTMIDAAQPEPQTGPETVPDPGGDATK